MQAIRPCCPAPRRSAAWSRGRPGKCPLNFASWLRHRAANHRRPATAAQAPQARAHAKQRVPELSRRRASSGGRPGAAPSTRRPRRQLAARRGDHHAAAPRAQSGCVCPDRNHTDGLRPPTGGGSLVLCRLIRTSASSRVGAGCTGRWNPKSELVAASLSHHVGDRMGDGGPA
jgi:hypothetical protein